MNMCYYRVVVVEEPGEEPKLYRQDTGELVGDGAFVDPFLNAENNEHPNELPPRHQSHHHHQHHHHNQTGRTSAEPKTPSNTKSRSTPSPQPPTPSSSQQQPTAKLYKDIDDLIEKLRLEQQQQSNKKSASTESNKPMSNGSFILLFLK